MAASATAMPCRADALEFVLGMSVMELAMFSASASSRHNGHNWTIRGESVLPDPHQAGASRAGLMSTRMLS